ncbi:hypothetical protein SKAU_G00199530 [Synaphobranchus kaupii]|uniref:Uncharacterized protein n=1 Tax=Synaphobranchus kaupii TaxID=118154 RepID=A0A9Q1IX56_SYNKA|nr:hypothetical protein SKAU_G00199530 [Synaphobranchus kaupii]
MLVVHSLNGPQQVSGYKPNFSCAFHTVTPRPKRPGRTAGVGERGHNGEGEGRGRSVSCRTAAHQQPQQGFTHCSPGVIATAQALANVGQPSWGLARNRHKKVAGGGYRGLQPTPLRRGRACPPFGSGPGEILSVRKALEHFFSRLPNNERHVCERNASEPLDLSAADAGDKRRAGGKNDHQTSAFAHKTADRRHSHTLAPNPRSRRASRTPLTESKAARAHTHRTRRDQGERKAEDKVPAN